MITKRPKRNLRKSELDNITLFDETKEGKEPEKWTFITALDCVLEEAKNSQLSEVFWAKVQSPIDFLTKELELTRVQVVFLALMIEAGEPMSWRKFGNFLNCSRLSMMVYSEELDELVAKRWLYKRAAREMGGIYEGFALVKGVITALRHNEKFVPEKIDGLTEQQFVDKLESHIAKNEHDHNVEFSDDELWMLRLCEANPHLPLCHEVLSLTDIHEQSLLLMMVYDYAQYADSEFEGLTFNAINEIYPEDWECNGLRYCLREESHVLIERGLIEHKCEEGMADSERFVLTKRAKEELLSAYKPSCSKVRKSSKDSRYLTRFSSIKEKSLFFNSSEQEQIERLTSLLSQENLPSIQQRLEEQGMRKGFACLFHGGPGTGKTETVLQIARKTGRDIMQIDIAGLRDKFVGESEKNIKAVFAKYKDLCKNSEVMPILFFNEADGIFGKRTQNVERSVEKMDNAMQNIILQEIEDLEGILIATTNLTQNLDSAFERRFLFKVEFHKPNTEVKAKIWSSMLSNISEEDAHTLASEFDFSGGQIENIARKRTIDFILNGEFADLKAIEGYCRHELLEDKKACRPVVGFGA